MSLPDAHAKPATECLAVLDTTPMGLASTEAARRLQAATEQSERRIAHSKELAEELRVLRSRVLAQLLGIRGQLDSVPAMLASVNRESELLDAPESNGAPSKDDSSTDDTVVLDKEKADASS